ncbi:MAG: hypothetical protein AAGF12_33110 [Myxococcota bacterium]
MKRVALGSVSVVGFLTLVVASAAGLETRGFAWILGADAEVTDEIQPEPPAKGDLEREPFVVEANGNAEPHPAAEAPTVSDSGSVHPERSITGEAPSAGEEEPPAVPDLEGLRVDRAMAEAEAAGVRLQVTDLYGHSIHRMDHRLYRVRPDTLRPAAGEPVPAGGVLRARAYQMAGLADGY